MTSFGDLSGSVEVGIDWPGRGGPARVLVNGAHGRGRGGVVSVPASVAGDISVTLHPLGGPVTFHDVPLEGSSEIRHQSSAAFR